MTTLPADYETTLPKVFHVLAELEQRHHQVDVAVSAIEWGICRLEESGWSLEEIRTHLQLLLDPSPPEGSA